MLLALLGALTACVCFGVATVLQAVAARAVPVRRPGVDPRLLAGLAVSPLYVVGVLLDLTGFLAGLAALRSLPLFVVQAMSAASLAVTAVAAAGVMRLTPSRTEWSAVGAVCAGLVMLGLSSGPESPEPVGMGFRWSLCAAVALLLAAGALAGRLPCMSVATVLGLVTGLCYGVVAISARVLTGLTPRSLLADPAAYAMAGGGLAAMLFLATALQRGSVTATTAAMVVTETAVPAVVGVGLLHDSTWSGMAPLAAAGFTLAVVGSLLLARFGEPRDAAPAEAAD